MPKDLEVKTDNESLKLNGEAGRIVFTVNNGAGRPLHLRGEPRPVDKTKAEWLMIVDGDRKDLGSPGFQSFTVEVKPTGAEPGPYRFIFRAFDVDDPNEHWGESREIAFEVPKPPDPTPQPKPKWPWILLVVLLLLVGGGVTAWLLTRGVLVPTSLKGLTVADATAVLEKAGLKAKSPATTQPSTEVEAGKVIQSDPAMGKKAKKGSAVALIVAAAPPAPPATQPTPTPPSPADKFLGDWVNTAGNQGIRVIDTITIATDGDSLAVRVMGFATNDVPGDWGLSRTSLSDATDGNLQVSWRFVSQRLNGTRPPLRVTRTIALRLSVSSDNQLIAQSSARVDPPNLEAPSTYNAVFRRKLGLIHRRVAPGAAVIDSAKVQTSQGVEGQKN